VLNQTTAVQNMFEVETTHTLTRHTLHQLQQIITKRVNTSWLDMVLSNKHTVNILLETTDDVDRVSHTIAMLIQNSAHLAPK